MSVAIIDYGAGNLRSAEKAFERTIREAGRSDEVVLTANPDVVARAERVVLPGDGAFLDCRRNLDAIPGMAEAIVEAIDVRARPFLGICVGMQLMAERGLEYGETPGFGWIGGDVMRIEPADPALKVPHMGWNTLDVVNPHPLLENIPTGPGGLHAYFVHSYRFACAEAANELATVDYGGPVAAVIGRDNLVGTQFHPEKSQAAGLRLIANFLRWRP